MKTFDMGKHTEKYRDILEATRPPDFHLESYVAGMAVQFGKDLMIVGRAVMPGGEIVEAFPQEKDGA
jgi:hypothetical protein